MPHSSSCCCFFLRSSRWEENAVTFSWLWDAIPAVVDLSAVTLMMICWICWCHDNCGASASYLGYIHGALWGKCEATWLNWFIVCGQPLVIWVSLLSFPGQGVIKALLRRFMFNLSFSFSLSQGQKDCSATKPSRIFCLRNSFAFLMSSVFHFWQEDESVFLLE